MKRDLSLKRETLSELTTPELSAVAAGLPRDSGPACPVWEFLRENFDDPTILWCRTV